MTPHYLPHRPVIRKDAEITKVCVVYYVSCKDKQHGVSLNDCLLMGPSLTPLLFDLLISWRTHKVALVADIEKAFLNVEVDPTDRDRLRFLWVDDIQAQNPSILIYRLNRVVFGVNSSPFLLNAVLRHHIDQYDKVDTEFTSKIRKEFYVDDWVSGANNVEAALDLYHKVKARMKEGGFNLRKWKSNDSHLAQTIENSETEIGTDSKSDLSYAKTVLQAGQCNSTKVLGIEWERIADTLHFDLSRAVADAQEKTVTKRSILSTLAKIFDLLGIVSPYHLQKFSFKNCVLRILSEMRSYL